MTDTTTLLRQSLDALLMAQVDVQGALYSGVKASRIAAAVKALQEELAQPAPAPEELSPEFTDTARAALLWVLWHHQGASSAVGQPIRFALGMGAHDRLNEHQIAEAKRWATTTGSTTAEFHKVPAAPAVPDGLRGAVNALLHQIEIGDFVDSNGHSAKMLKPVHDLMRLISESAAPAVREPLHAWEFVAMWATAAEKHGNTYDAAVEFGCAVEARCAAAPAVREPKPLAAVNRYCAAGMCLPKDQHEAGCTAHGIGTQGGGT
jgi:hypothetical protein